jgi:ribosomal protein L29
MAKNKNPFKDMKNEDLTSELYEKREALRKLRFSVAGSRGKDAHMLKVLKKDIARILTEQSARAKATIA